MNTILLAPTMLRDSTPLEYIQAAIAGGYEAIGFRVHRSLVMPSFYPVVGDAPLIREIKRMTSGAGIRILEVASFYVLPEMDWDDYQAALELGAELGAKFALALGRDPEWSRLCDNFGRLCAIADNLGMIVGVENGGENTAPRIARMIAESGATNGSICLDPPNHYLAGGTNADLAAMDPKLFPYIQMADAVLDDAARELVNGRPKHLPRLMLGDGNLDIAGLLDVMPANVPLSLELPLSTSALLPGSNGQEMTPDQWSRHTVVETNRYLEAYYRQRTR